MNNCGVLFKVTDYGANGIAEPAETLHLRNLRFQWVEYPQGATATIYSARPGEEYDSAGIQRAIDAAHAAGGGTVVVPAGDYLIGPIELRSRVRLHLEPGARLWGSPNMDDYATQPGEKLPAYTLANGFNRASEGLTRENRRLISAHDASDFGITGFGQISAQSPAFVIPWMNHHPKDLLSLHRPQDTLLFYRCERVFVEGVRIVDTPSWTMVFDSCREVRVHGIGIHSFDVINSDGIDLVNTSDVTISDCRIHCTDDAICLKNTVVGATMRNIAVTNCVIRTLCNGFKIGTDSLGNFEDITASNLVMHGEDSPVGDRGAINLCALDGGSVRNVNISNLVLRNMFCPFYLYATARTAQRTALGLKPRPGQMEGISITNVSAEGTRYPCYIVGHPDQPVRNIHVSNIRMRKARDFYKEIPEGPVPELPDQYPTPFTFGSRDRGDQLPACGLYLRNVEAATIRDFRLEGSRPDARELFVQEQCSDVVAKDLANRVHPRKDDHSSRNGAPIGGVEVAGLAV